MLELPVSEVIYHLEVFDKAKTIEKQAYADAQRSQAAESLITKAPDMEWEEV